jgi:oligopeptidase A
MMLPSFSNIKAEQILPTIKQLIEDNNSQISNLLEATESYNWNNLIQPINELNDRLNRIWSPIEHLHNVADYPELRSAYNSCLPLLSAYHSELGQNKSLFDAYKFIHESAEFNQLNTAQQKVISNKLRDFHLSGIDLPAEKQARYKQIQEQLSKLNTKFSENVLDATHAWKKHITDESLLAGLPESVLALAKQNAKDANLTGWLLTLDFPCYQPVMNYADNRELRYEMYKAYVTRASAGQWDNSDIMPEIVSLRQELAQLLGFANYAEYSLSTKMAETPKQVLDFLTDLAKRAKPVALKELEQLTSFAKQQLEPWDIPYYSEKLRQHLYDISEEQLRPYFPLNKVLTGLFKIVQKLYGLIIKENTHNIDTWHQDVQFFDVYDETGELRGQFYLDCFARKAKRGGAWMDECIIRHRTNKGLQTPVAYLCCNFTPPVDDKISLLTHKEVITLFHEFGHGLHHILTQVDYAPVAGINGVAWDAVELPSQFMENFCWQEEALDLFAEALPAELFTKMLAAKNFQAGMFTLRQIEFGLFDFRLHQEGRTDIQNLLDEVRQQVAVLFPPDFNRFQHSFSHIFAGGYAAGYYSYKWAELLSADAFSKFEDNGIFDSATGQQFLQTILEKGGSEQPMELFIKFRERTPKIDALLRHSGMMKAII